MARNTDVLIAKGGFLTETYRESGFLGCARKIIFAIKMSLPLMAMGRRTNSSVGAYFDIITDDARRFYGDNFHFGYFKNENDSFIDAVNNHTDVVALMAELENSKRVLDLGCGICAPAIRIVGNHDCHITGINISGEQVKQGQRLVEEHGLSNRITIKRGSALKLDFDDSTFDSILCIEVAGDICVKHEQKMKFARELYRILKPGGHIGFSDLVFTGRPTRKEEDAMRTILYHDGAELMTDWPSIFEKQGFTIKHRMDIIEDTRRTWDHSISIYEERAAEVERRYGKRIAKRTLEHLRQIPKILEKHGSFIVMSIEKPASFMLSQSDIYDF